jgi:hypothetical protein
MGEKKQLLPLCGLWKGKARDGKTYLSGKLTYSTSIKIFENEWKKNPRDPDYRLYLTEYQAPRAYKTPEETTDMIESWDSKVMDPEGTPTIKQALPMETLMPEDDIPF